MADIDVGQLSEAINNKMDRDLGNKTTDIDYVIDSFNDGTNWYRVYKSGWCEQGGYLYLAGGTTGVVNTTQLLKTFLNANYYIMITAGVGNSGWQYANGVGIGTAGADANRRELQLTPSSFTWFNSSGVDGVPIFWEAKGQLAEGQY